jgi:DNA repair protein RadC
MEQEIKQPDWCRVAEIELVYKIKPKPSDRPKVQSSKEIYDLLIGLWNHDKIDIQEEFKVLFLNRSNRVLGIYHASTGGMCMTVVDARLILLAAIKAGACIIVLSHNHPSGNLKPSRPDEDLTAKIKNAAGYLDIKVLDHIIITSDGYFSFADEGIL